MKDKRKNHRSISEFISDILGNSVILLGVVGAVLMIIIIGIIIFYIATIGYVP